MRNFGAMHHITNHSIQAVHLGLEAQVFLEYPCPLEVHGHQVCLDLLFHLAAHHFQAVQVDRLDLSVQDRLTTATIHTSIPRK